MDGNWADIDTVKKHKMYFSITAAALAAIFVHKETKRKQNQARSMGRHVPYGPYEAVFKRLLDIIMSGVAFVLLSPVMVGVGTMVRLEIGKPVLFKQQRPGMDGKIFTIYKFRTMTNEKGLDGKLLPDEERLTEFGKKLRSSSLDELPELVNILKGDMSFVGPRPLLVEYLPKYNERQKHRHDVKPGLTGFAQVSGRNSLTWEEKFRDDIDYVNNISFLKDFRIILKTIGIVLKKSGIHSNTSATMEVFMGTTMQNHKI